MEAGGAAQRTTGGFRGSMGMPVARSDDFGAALRRLGGLLSAERTRLGFVLFLTVASVFLVVLGPRLLGEATDIIVRGLLGGRGDRLRRPAPDVAADRSDLPGVMGALLRSGLHPRRRGPTFDVLVARTGRGQAQPAASQPHRSSATGRSAEPGHQRHRQPVAEPPTDDQSDIDLNADADRRGGDDVHDLPAPGRRRAGHGARRPVADEADRR